MKNLKYIRDNINELQHVIFNNAPNGINASNIRVEHYSTGNENRIIIENIIKVYGFTIPYSATIGNDLETRIVFHGINDSFRRRLLIEQNTRQYLINAYNNWLNTDESMLNVLVKILSKS